MSKKTVSKPEIVWVNCRALESCEGNQSEVLRRVSSLGTGDMAWAAGLAGLGGGGTIRYRCLTCLREFSVTY